MKKMYNSLRLLLVLLLGSHMGSFAQTSFYSTVGGPYLYTVPAGVTGITVNVKGAKGGQNSDPLDYDDRGGAGGCVQAVISVTPGQVLHVYVGGCGADGTATTGGAGGFNGGGAGSYGVSTFSGGGGGGASDIRLAPYTTADRIVVGGGGGGAGLNCGGNADRGGDGGSATLSGGGETGAAGCGTSTGGGGGLYGVGGSLGGTCTSCGGAGVPGTGGDDVTGGAGGNFSAGGGGGGGFGAGGGGEWTGGGGGSNYYGGTGVTLLTQSRGCNAACGSVSIVVSCIAGTISGANNVCVGSSTAPLTETVGGGTWSSSNTVIATVGSTSGVVTGVNAGVVTISYVLSAYCAATYQVTVNPLPGPITGLITLCKNDTTTYTDPTPGGTWSSSNTSIATVGSANGFVTAVGAGTCNIIYTVTSTGCTAAVPILVNPVPTPILGQDSVCSGGSVVLTDATSGGTWSSSVLSTASIVGSGTSATVTGAAAGTSIISYTFPSTGCAARVVFTVNALPAGIGGPSHLCMGQISTETNITPGGTWSATPGTGSASINPSTGAVTPISLGTVDITYTLPTTCFVTRQVTVHPTPLPITTLTSGQVCVGSTILLSDATGGGTWTTGAPLVATVSGGTVTGVAVAGGTATIFYTVGFCASNYVVTVNPLPAAITGPNTVCQGDCTQVYGSGGGPGTWTSSDLTVGTIDATTGTFCAITSGTVTLTYQFTSTGCTRSKTITVNPTPGPILPSPTQVCLGSTVTLTATPAGGNWNTTSSNVALIGSTGAITGTALGTADVTYTALTTCTVNAIVTVNPLPNPIDLLTGVNPLCQGDTARLESPGSPAGTWSSDLTPVATVGPTTGLVTGIAGGIAHITYTITATGCKDSYSMTILSGPTPISAPYLMCLTDPPLTVSSGGGTGVWSSSNSGVATIAAGTPASNGVITPVTTGTTTLCYEFTPTPGCKVCETFTVTPAPGPIVPTLGSYSICTGRTLALSDPTTPGGTWTSSNPAVATVGSSTGFVTGISSVGSPVTITYLLGGCSRSIVVSVNASPAAITGTTSVCQGLSTSLCTTGPGPGGYTWSSSNLAVATLSSAGLCATVTGVGSGTSLIDYTNNFTGCYSQATVNITSGIAAISGPNSVCMGSTIVETEATNGNWLSTPTTIATVTGTAPGPTVNNTTVTPVSTGTFTLTFSSPTGCSATKVITVNPIPVSTVVPLGSTNLCPGGFVELTASTGTGYTYQWLNPGVIAGATNSTYTVNSAGSYSVFVSNGPCSITTPATPVTMNPATATITASGPLTTCASTAPTLTAFTAAGYSYQWQLGGVPIAGAVTNTFTPTTSGNYTVVESNSFGCSATSTAVSITLVGSPAGTVTLSGPITVCAGNSVTITGDAGTGYTYQWYNGGLGAPITGATNISYTATVSGNYFVVVTNSTGCSTQSATTAVVVYPAPVARVDTASSTRFCTGGSVTLSAPAVAGNGFQWYKDGVAITGATSVSYIASSTGVYKVRVDSPAIGCSSMSPGQSVTVVTAPNLVPFSPTNFCWGSSAHLGAVLVSGAGTVGYQWSLNGVNIPGATNSTYDAPVSGDYAVTVSVGGGVCSTSSAAVTVHENPLPNPLVTFDGTNFHVQTYYTSYIWYYNTAVIPGATTATTPAIGSGAYKVKVTDTNGCQSVSAGYPLSGWTGHNVGVVNTNNGPVDIKIYPNPAQDEIRIEAPVVVRAVVSGIDGRTLIDEQAATVLNISKLPNGIYTIKLFDAAGQMVKADKLVKEGK